MTARSVATPALWLRPWTVKRGIPFNLATHRRLPEVQGAMWAISVREGRGLADSSVVGVALVGWAARLLCTDDETLSVLRCAVLEGHMNACSMLYGACSRAAKAMGAANLVTYTHGDEHGSSLKASNWIHGGTTSGGEWDRDERQRELAIDPLPKNRWWAPWYERAKSITLRGAA